MFSSNYYEQKDVFLAVGFTKYLLASIDLK